MEETDFSPVPMDDEPWEELYFYLNLQNVLGITLSSLELISKYLCYYYFVGQEGGEDHVLERIPPRISERTAQILPHLSSDLVKLNRVSRQVVPSNTELFNLLWKLKLVRGMPDSRPIVRVRFSIIKHQDPHLLFWFSRLTHRGHFL